MKTTIAIHINSSETAKQARLLMQSFPASLAGRMEWLVTVDSSFSEVTELPALADVCSGEILRLDIPAPFNQYPLGWKVYAAARAEEFCLAGYSMLVWMDTDTIVLSANLNLSLPSGKAISCCPVHLCNIASRWGEEMDPFWKEIYAQCKVTADNLFPVKTIVDEVLIRPYFNVGLLVLDPQKRLFRTWQDHFIVLSQNPVVSQLLHDDKLHRIFFHQAVLAGTILGELNRGEIHQLDHTYNFPVFLSDRFDKSFVMPDVKSLKTIRYDELSELARKEWQNRFPNSLEWDGFKKEWELD